MSLNIYAARKNEAMRHFAGRQKADIARRGANATHYYDSIKWWHKGLPNARHLSVCWDDTALEKPAVTVVERMSAARGHAFACATHFAADIESKP